MKKTTETLAELQARKATLEQDITKLEAKDDALSKAELRATRAEAAEIEARIQIASDTDKYAGIEARETERKTKEAKAGVQKLIGLGAVAVRDTKKQAELEAKFIADPSMIEIMIEASGSGRGTSRQITPRAAALDEKGNQRFQVGADYEGAVKGMAQLCASNAKAGNPVDKISAASEIGAIYAKELRPIYAKGEYVSLEAATDADTLGTLSGTLVAQRTLDLYKFEFPVLDSITTDFSDLPAQFNQTTTTRIIVVPSVISYDATLGTDGRPAGWTVTTPAQTVDASVTLNKHRAVDIIFDANTLASTMRRLFEEMAPAAAYALGKDVVDSLYAVITPGNYTTNTAISIGALNFGRPTFAKAKKVLNKLGVPFTNRFALANSDYQEMLEQDPTLVSLAVFQKPEIITNSELPQIARFRPIEAPNLPATAWTGGAALQAFFAHKSALLMQSRIPNDWSSVLGPSSTYGSVNVVTNPDTGLSVLLVQFSNPQSSHAEYRLSLIYGVAKGNEKGGQPVTN
jgi:hypothetical protein